MWTAQAQTYIKNNYADTVQIGVYRNAMSLLMAIEDNYHGDVDGCIVDSDSLNEEEMEILVRIRQKYEYLQIVFWGETHQIIPHMFDVAPMAYMEQPVDAEALCKTVDKILLLSGQKRRGAICVATSKSIHRIMHSDIRYLESQKRIVKIHTGYGVTEVRDTLGNIGDQLPGEFLRCHQSFIVNMNQIRELSKNAIILFDETVIPVSRPRYTYARTQFMEFLHMEGINDKINGN